MNYNCASYEASRLLVATVTAVAVIVGIVVTVTMDAEFIPLVAAVTDA